MNATTAVRDLDVGEITLAAKELCITANYGLPRDVCDALVRARG